jgi:hypothetical protein
VKNSKQFFDEKGEIDDTSSVATTTTNCPEKSSQNPHNKQQHFANFGKNTT